MAERIEHRGRALLRRLVGQGAPASRYWEVDALRGAAMLAMAFFHTMWDLSFFEATAANLSAPFWQRFARGIGSTFLFLVGVSLTLSHARTGEKAGWRKYLTRGATVFGWGLAITIVTYIGVRWGFVVWGILHTIGFAIAVSFPLLPYRRRGLALAGAAVLIALGAVVKGRTSTGPWWIWLGINQIHRPMVDWYPVLPWLGVVLLGIGVGHLLYPQGKRRLHLPDLSGAPVLQQLAFLGRYALPFYLLHQPLILGVLALLHALSLLP